MLNAIGTGVTEVISWGGEVLTAIVGETGAFGAVLPVVGISVGLGIVGWGIKTIKSLVWGF